jgi:hypothetical protein
MRHWFLVLMIALLPLRGWVGDALAVEMLAQPAHASMAMGGHGADHSIHHAAHDGQCDCSGHASDDQADHQHEACDVCNVPALAMAVPAIQSPPAEHGQLTLAGEPFASSEAQRGVKPPIS